MGKERLVTANGCGVSWSRWGGGVAGDVCAAARGDGRRWAAERLGLAGVVVEADTALGGVAVLASVGTYGGARTAAKTSVEAVKAAGRVAEGYRAAAAARAVGLLYGLWQGALLGGMSISPLAGARFRLRRWVRRLPPSVGGWVGWRGLCTAWLPAACSLCISARWGTGGGLATASVSAVCGRGA